jgi:hypothetical protein
MSFSPVEVAVFLLGMGFTEVIVKPLAINFFKRTFSLLPRVFDKLDPIMPETIAKMSPADVEKRIYGAIEGAAQEEGKKLSDTEKKALYEEFIRLYNPVIAASKAL